MLCVLAGGSNGSQWKAPLSVPCCLTVEPSSQGSSSALPLPPRLSYDKAPPMAFTLAQCYGATRQPSRPQPSVLHLPIATQCPSTLPRQLLLPQWSCTETAFHCKSVQVHFCLCCQERGGGGGGPNKGRCFTFNLPSTCTYHLMSRFKINWTESCKTTELFLSLAERLKSFFFSSSHISKVKPVCHLCSAPNERHMHIYECSPAFTCTDTHTHSGSRQWGE